MGQGNQGSQGDVLGLRIGETIDSVRTKGRRWTVNETDARWLPQMHAYLAEIAKAHEKVTYGQVKEDLDMPHVPNGMGRLLDLLSEACVDRQKQPSLAALVVNQDTGEVGADFAGDPVREREACYRYPWP